VTVGTVGTQYHSGSREGHATRFAKGPNTEGSRWKPLSSGEGSSYTERQKEDG